MSGKMSASNWCSAAVLLASITSVVPVLGQSGPAPSGPVRPTPTAGISVVPAPDDTEKEATTLYDDGVKEAKAGSWEKARVAMLAAFKLKPKYAWAANLGKVELKAAKPRDAAEHLSFFLREAPTIEPDDRADVEKMLSDAKVQIGTATIRVNETGAQVLVDGQMVGAAPLNAPVFVVPGNRRFEARKAGLVAGNDVQILAGSSPVVDLKLVQAAPAVALRVQPKFDVPAEPAIPGWKIPFVAGGSALAAVGIGVGVAYLAYASKQQDAVLAASKDAKEHQPEGNDSCPSRTFSLACRSMFDHASTRDSYRNIAIAGFAVGGVSATGAILAILWKPKKTGASAVSQRSFLLVPAPQGALFAVGSF